MVFCHTFCAWGLSRPPSCSGTIATILVLGDCPDHHHARGLFRPLSCSGLSRLPSCSGTAPTIAQRPLSSATYDLYSHTVERHLFFSHLDLATRLIPRLPASSGTTSVRCTCRCNLYCLYDDWILNLTVNSF